MYTRQSKKDQNKARAERRKVRSHEKRVQEQEEESRINSRRRQPMKTPAGKPKGPRSPNPLSSPNGMTPEEVTNFQRNKEKYMMTETPQKNLQSELNANANDPLGIVTPLTERDRFYDQAGHRIGGEVVRSQADREREAYEETYLTDEEEFKREVDDVSDFEEGVDYIQRPKLPNRPPPSRPEKGVLKTTERPNVQIARVQSGQVDQRNILGGMPSTRILDDRKMKTGRVQKIDKDLRQPMPRRNVPRPFDNTRLISGSQEIKPIQGADGGGVPNTYVDHLAPESYISQDAHDKEEYRGANPRDHTSQDLRVIEQLRRQEYEDDADRVRDIVQEVEILSGGQNDSLMDGQDLVDEQKYDTDYDNHRGHSRSGIQRGRDAHAIPEIDLEDIESSLSQFFGEEDAPEGISDDSASIGRRFGQAIPRVRGGFNQDDDVQSVMSGSDSIMSTISGLTSLSDKDGSWFSKDKDLEKDIDVNERMSGINKIPMSKDAQTEIGKFNPMMNAGNKLLMSQGASLGTISEMRKKEINYKQPNRKFKNDAINLVRLGNQTNIKMKQEYDP